MFEIGKPEIEAVVNVLENGQMMRVRGGEGGYADSFERNLREKFDVPHALSVTSGTAALISSLASLGIGPGDEVIIPAYTWIATAIAPLAVGAVPILAEVDNSLTLDPEDIERKATEHTKAVIPVHMTNMPCDMDAIMALARKLDLLVCEDACQAMGMTYKNRRLGTIGDAGAYSFNQFKNLSSGEGGALVTSCDKTYARALMYHDVGAFTRDYASSVDEPFFLGFNYRSTEIQGAIMSEQLKRLDGILSKLRERRKVIAEILSQSDRFKLVKHHDEENAVSVAIQFDSKDSAAAFKEERGGNLLIDSGYHLYRNWEPLLEQRFFHPKMNPFNWSHRKIEYSKDMCPKSLDILARSMNISVPYTFSIDEVREHAKKWVD